MRSRSRSRGGWWLVVAVVVIAVGVWVWNTRRTGGGGADGVSAGVAEWLPVAGTNRVEVVHHRHYSLGYREDWEQAAWVVERLKGEMLVGKAGRTDDFREDPLVSTGSASPGDYWHSGYDRGHLAPAADFSFDREAVSESFFMSNMSPQTPSLNRGPWKRLEEWVRTGAKREGELIVVTGPIVTDAANAKRIGANGVVVPQLYFKAVYDLTPPEKMIAFLYANRSGEASDVAAHAVCVDRVEELTGLDLFASLPDATEDRLEAEIGDWGLGGGGAGPSHLPSGDATVGTANTAAVRTVGEEAKPVEFSTIQPDETTFDFQGVTVGGKLEGQNLAVQMQGDGKTAYAYLPQPLLGERQCVLRLDGAGAVQKAETYFAFRDRAAFKTKLGEILRELTTRYLPAGKAWLFATGEIEGGTKVDYYAFTFYRATGRYILRVEAQTISASAYAIAVVIQH